MRKNYSLKTLLVELMGLVRVMYVALFVMSYSCRKADFANTILRKLFTERVKLRSEEQD
jgi:hypothetical protein